MNTKTRRVGIYSNSPEEISNRLFSGAQSYINSVKGLIARDYCPQEKAGLDSTSRPPWQGQADGVMISTGLDAGKSAEDMAEWVLSGGVPAVMTGADWSDPRIPRFFVDSNSLGELAAQHLTECGCRSYLYVGYGLSSGSAIRGNAFDAALARRDHQLVRCAVGYKCLGTAADVRVLKTEQRLVSSLRRMRRPLGIWTLNDRFAAALCLLCQDLGIPVPKSIKILGVDDISLARSPEFAISSIRTPNEEIARLAMQTLHRMLKRQPVKRSPLGVPATELFARKSTLGKTPVHVSIADSQTYISAHACTGVTVEHLARTLGVSRRTFELQFHELVGHSPREEIQRVRLERAKELLRESEFSIDRIASMIGFMESAAFSKFFRNQTGDSPRAFRKATTSR